MRVERPGDSLALAFGFFEALLELQQLLNLFFDSLELDFDTILENLANQDRDLLANLIDENLRPHQSNHQLI